MRRKKWRVASCCRRARLSKASSEAWPSVVPQLFSAGAGQTLAAPSGVGFGGYFHDTCKRPIRLSPMAQKLGAQLPISVNLEVRMRTSEAFRQTPQFNSSAVGGDPRQLVGGLPCNP